MNNKKSERFLESLMPVLRPPFILLKSGKRKIMETAIKIRPIKISNKRFIHIMNYSSINELLIRKDPEFHINPTKKEYYLSEMDNYSKFIDRDIKDADKICKHVFDFLGSGEKNLGENINWHQDFKSGYIWNPNSYFVGSDVHLEYIKKGIGADVKVPWELSRFQHIPTLGKAFWYTNNETYVQEFIKEINSWIKNNPVKLGVNWACTMDVAIRAVNWIWGYYFFCESGLLTEKFKIKFFKTLYLHGRFVRNYLEFGDVRGNHYLSNIAGLVYLGIFFHESEEAQEWILKGIEALIEEMNYQVLPDGVNSELSSNYHRLTAEIFISTTLLCLKNNIKLPQSYLNRLEKMLEFILYYTKSDGSAPQIGDSDDGKFQILSNYYDWNRNDHRYLLSIGAVLFGRDDFKLVCPEFNEESFWLLGEKNETPEELLKERLNLNSKSFDYSGFHIMRQEDLYMIIDATNPNTKFLQGHRHNSALSFELSAYGKNFIIDPGSYIYTANPKMRNLFRSTKYHNTIQVDGAEQNTITNDLFFLGTEAKIKVLQWKVSEEKDLFEGEHYGYERLKNPVTHKRQILFDKKMKLWIIKDVLKATDKHRFDLFFHLPDVELEKYESHLGFLIENNRLKIAIIPLKPEDLIVKVIEGYVSYSYGKKTKAPIIQYSKEGTDETVFMNLIVPFKKREELKDILKNLKIPTEITNN